MEKMRAIHSGAVLASNAARVLHLRAYQFAAVPMLCSLQPSKSFLMRLNQTRPLIPGNKGSNEC